MRSEDLTILRECVLEAAFEGLTACSIPVERGVAIEAARSHGGDGPEELAAFIGFSGADVRGMLTLVAPLSIVRDSYPAPLQGEDCTEAFFDWTGEMVNQLMGRFKNKLLGRGLEVHASTPKTVRAWQLAIGRSARSSICSLAFRAGAADVGVHFDATAKESVVLFPAGAVAVVCVPEGALELF